MTYEKVSQNLETLLKKIEAARNKSPLKQSVTLIGVSKKQPLEAVGHGVRAGLRDLGENYVQEFESKYSLFPNVCWHLIGPLQSNKAKNVIGKVDYIHTLDRVSLAEVLNRLSGERSLRQKVLVQVNVAGEATKSGVSADQVEDFFSEVQKFEGIEICGLMTMPPFVDDPELSRPYFRRLRQLRDQLQKRFSLNLPLLSMGTSQDFEVAVEEGATHVRVGSLLFGERT